MVKFYNHVIYGVTEQEVAKRLPKCEGCEACPKGLRHTCRHFYEVENGSYQPYCTKRSK